MNLLAPAAQYAPAGLRALLVGPWTPGASYVYASAQADILNELDPAQVWWPVDCQQVPAASQFSETYGRDKQGDAYSQAIAVALPGLQVALRAGLQNLLNLPLVALCQDMRGQWWLLGQDCGLRVPAYGAGSGPVGSDSLTSWQLTGRQTQAMRQVALDGPVTIVDYAFNPNGSSGSTGGSLHTLPFTLA